MELLFVNSVVPESKFLMPKMCFLLFIIGTKKKILKIKLKSKTVSTVAFTYMPHVSSLAPWESRRREGFYQELPREGFASLRRGARDVPLCSRLRRGQGDSQTGLRITSQGR